MIELININKKYDDTQNFILNNISLKIFDGEILVLFGPSGSGKSTLLNILNGSISPSNGEIYIDGQNINHRDLIDLHRSIGFVFQQNCLMPHWNIEENVATVLRLAGIPRAARLKRAHELLHLVQLDPKIYAQRFPFQLSGGQQQRVNVARAFANDPQYILMDEPFSALDSVNRLNLQQEVLRLKKQLNKTIVFVTHDKAEACYLADRIVVLKEGRIDSIDTPQKLSAN